MKKSTEELANELDEIHDEQGMGEFIRSNEEEQHYPCLAEYLTMLLEEKHTTKAKVVAASGIESAYVYRLFSGEKKDPSRDKVIALAFGLGIDFDRTQRLLKYSGQQELYARNKRDSLITFAIRQGYSLMETNDLLNDAEEKIIE